MTRSGGGGSQLPKYAQFERERRWLVDPAARPDLGGLPFTLIEDSYLCGTRMRLRRMTDSANNATTLKLTKKYEAVDPLARAIVTAYLTESEYTLFSVLPAQRVAKRRYKLGVSDEEFSLDQFEYNLLGLELLEIECCSDKALRAIIPPSWAEIEVSHDPRFQGGALAGYSREELEALRGR